VLLTTFVLTACGYIYGDNGLIKSQEYDYLAAKQTKELSIPDPLIHKSKSDYTVVPKIGEKATNSPTGKSLAQAAPIQLLAVLDNTRVDKKADVPTVLVMDSVDFIWQTVTQFFEKYEIQSEVIDQENYLLETRWVPIEKGGIWLGIEGSEEPDLERAKYRVSITDSNLPGEHRLVVERMASEIREDDDLDWQSQYISWRDSADMMNLVLSHYDTRLRIQEAAHQLKIMAGFNVQLGQNESEEAALITDADETLVWEKIPRVMREIGMTILERDDKQKTYFMEYKAEEEGFFASLFDDESTSGLFEEGAYQISLGKSGEQRSMTLRDGQGVALEASKLVSLFPELSRLFGDRR